MVTSNKRKYFKILNKDSPPCWVLKVILVLQPTLAGEVLAQQVLQENQIWASSVVRDRGQPVIPTYEGWYTNQDGTHSLCYGYFNLNMKETLEIPHGSLNRLEGVDDGVFTELQTPTHFDPMPPRYRRKFCVFTVNVPADFSQQDRVVWHLSSAGQTFQAQGHINPYFFLDEPETRGRLKKAPTVTISDGDEPGRGRNGVYSRNEVKAVVGSPVELSLYRIESEVDRVWVGWSKYSGPGEVVFSNAEGMIEGNTIVSAETEATFSEPGEYVIYAQAIENIADFEFFCCHTNAYLRVNVSQ
ncbi:MAG: hypothetical protein Q7L19_04195 [Pseudohongiella sp.]|nr:hypothetical protein [Pseudohongiella sp.]